MTRSIRAIVGQLLLWLLTALGGLTVCAGLWDYWLARHLSLLTIGLAMLGLVILTRQWARPERPTGGHAHVPVFVAITLCVPAVAVLSYGGIFVLLAVTLGSMVVSEGAASLITTVSATAAVVIAAFFFQREIRREQRRGTTA